MTCPVCRKRGLVSLVELLRVEHNAQAVTTNVRVRCPVCRWEGGPYET